MVFALFIIGQTKPRYFRSKILVQGTAHRGIKGLVAISNEEHS